MPPPAAAWSRHGLLTGVLLASLVTPSTLAQLAPVPKVPSFRSDRILVKPAVSSLAALHGQLATYDYVDSSAPPGRAFYRAHLLGPPRQNGWNIVGYLDLQAPAGDSFIANGLNASDNRVAALLPNVPEGTTLYRWDDGTDRWVINSFELGEWSDPNMTLVPGQGVRFRNPLGTALALTFAGEVVQGYGVNPVDNGFCVRSSIIPQAGRVTTDLMLPMMNGDRIWRLVGGSYVEYAFDNGAWSPAEPVLGVGEAFWTYKNVGFWWSRNFGSSEKFLSGQEVVG